MKGRMTLVGTYGGKMVTSRDNKVLFQGSGPIDGPYEVGSSTRSELGGFTAPLLLVNILSKYWGIRHRCEFQWLTDSKAAISKVKIYTTGSKRHQPPSKYPDHSDYVKTIMELCKELKCNITPHWIKGHQDDDVEYDKLSRDAKLNVDLDQLATHHRTKAISKPMRHIEHVESQVVSLTINGCRFPGNWETNLRCWSINGSYMKTYLLKLHQWSDRTWAKIDFTTVKSQFRNLTATQKTQRFKFIHNLQPVGTRKAKMAQTHTLEMLQCPCCKSAPETQIHMMIHCRHNPEYEAARNSSILSGGSKYNKAHQFVNVILDCLMQWIDDPTTIPSVETPYDTKIASYSDMMKPHMLHILKTALHLRQQKPGFVVNSSIQ
jgi:ribonuclease HI